MRLFYWLLYRVSLIDAKLAEERGDRDAHRDFVDRADLIYSEKLL
jgi:hypothetical protein